MTDSPLNTAAIILSGGAGTRLGGADKGLQCYHGKPLVEYVISTIEPQVDTIYLCANRNLTHYQSFGFEVVSDKLQHYEGPMSGISSALTAMIRESTAQQVLVTSCDVPYLPKNIRQRLESALVSAPNIDVSVVHDGARRQNLHCLIKRQAWPALIDFFENGGRAMHRWFDQVNTVDVDFSNDVGCFLNINTQEQLNSKGN